MAYQIFNKRNEFSIRHDGQVASQQLLVERRPDVPQFYELEEAVVLDVVLNDTHEKILNSNLNQESWPPNIDNSQPNPENKDYGIIGAIKFRFLNSQKNENKEILAWAFPIENTGVVEYPLVNEIVIVSSYYNKYFYTRKLNVSSVINSSADFKAEISVGDTISPSVNKNGKLSKINFFGGESYEGVLGKYFKFNPKIRTLKKFEGDTILESRFGSSIRFGSYDDNRSNDNGTGEYSDGGGNPMVLIRNRQAPIKSQSGYTGKGYTMEDINKDGSSIHITSGKTTSQFTPNTTTGIINVTKGVAIPSLNGDQIVFNSDRLVFSSKANEMLFFSKKMIGITTDQLLSLNSYGNTTITSNKGVITLNAPKIYLNFDSTSPNEQPVLRGRDTVLWLYALVDWMLLSVNNQIQTLSTIIAHAHMAPPPIGTTFPSHVPFLTLWGEQLQSLIASQTSLVALRSQLSALMSSRVFLGG